MRTVIALVTMLTVTPIFAIVVIVAVLAVGLVLYSRRRRTAGAEEE